MSTLSVVSSSHSPGCPLSPFTFFDSAVHNQRVPGSPASPFYGINVGSNSNRVPVHSYRAPLLSPGPVVPEIPSPLLRRILSTQSSQKRGSTSPLVASKKAKKPYEVLSVPNYAKHSEKMPVTPRSQEQVVPTNSPLCSSEEPQVVLQRKLPSSAKEGIKLLELFTEDDDIFASREE